MATIGNLEYGTPLRYYRNGAISGVLRELCTVDSRNRGRAPQGQGPDGGYEWLRKANAEDDRETRRKLAALTGRVVECRGYVLSSLHTVPLRWVSDMVDRTQLISPTWGKWPPNLTKNWPELQLSELPHLTVVKDVVLSVAAERTNVGRRVAAVNAASAYQVGGGFQSGGRHALEEAMCVQSSLFASLERAKQLGMDAGVSPPPWVRPLMQRNGSAWHMHLPDDGVALSPNVEIFRSGTFDGYSFDDRATMLEAIISVAMPNRNDRMSDAPVDAHPEHVEYVLQLERKWRAVLMATAWYTEADCLVVPDAGCGVFRNQPEDVGAALGSLLRSSEFGGRVKEIVIAYPGGGLGERFAEATAAALEGRTAEPSPISNAFPPSMLGRGLEAAKRAVGSVAKGGSVPAGKEGFWEFTVHKGWSAFDDESQAMVEAAWQTYTALGEPPVARIPARGGNTVIVDFTQMIQQVEGSNRTRGVRRRTT